MVERAYLNSLERHVTAAIKWSVEFAGLGLLHHQGLMNGIVKGTTRIYIPW
jgi:hypothetical protein